MPNLLLHSASSTVNIEATTKAAKLVRRRPVDSLLRDAKELERRRLGTLGMAIVAILVLAHRRLTYDSWVVLVFESIASLLFLLVAARLVRLSPTKRFTLDRERGLSLSDSSIDSESLALHQFLHHRRGPDYLFATAAALMLDHLGYRTRFVAGFYANPKRYVARETEIAILPSDAHAWLEIDVGHGYWIPLEPSPGYSEPPYTASLWFRLKQHRFAITIGTFLVSATLLCVYMLRSFLIEWASWVAFPALFLLNDRLRIAWLTRLLELRCRLAGIPRAKGTLLREHLHRFRTSLPTDLGQHVHVYLESADRIWFGGTSGLSKSDHAAIAGVWQGLTTKALRRGNQRMTEGQLA